MMDERELRLECLRIAAAGVNSAASVDSVQKIAGAYYEFVIGGEPVGKGKISPKDLAIDPTGYSARFRNSEGKCALCNQPMPDCLCGDPRPVAP